MAIKKLRIEEKFKESLKSRISTIWWGICIMLIVSSIIYGLYYRKNYQANLTSFAIIWACIIFCGIFFTLAFSFSRKKTFKNLISTLPPPNLSYVEELYQNAENLGYQTLGIVSKEGVNIINGFSMFNSIPKEDIVWIYQKAIGKDKYNQNIPGMTVVTKDTKQTTIPGYKVTNFLRSLFPNIYLSIEGSLKHKELQNMFSYDFGKMAQSTSKETLINTTPSTSNPKMAQEPLRTTSEMRTNTTTQEVKAPKTLQNSSNQKDKSKKLRSSARKFFIKLLLLGLILGGIALVLGIISIYPAVGKKVLISNTVLGGIYILFVTMMVISFLTKLTKRSLSKNALYFVFIALLSFGLKNSLSTFWDSFLDLKEKETKESFYTIRGIKYQNKIWLQENSECLFYISPIKSRRKEDLIQYNIRKSAFEDSNLIDELIDDQDRGPLPYLYMKQYKNSEIIEEVKIIPRSEYEELTKDDNSLEESNLTEESITTSVEDETTETTNEETPPEETAPTETESATPTIDTNTPPEETTKVQPQA